MSSNSISISSSSIPAAASNANFLAKKKRGKKSRNLKKGKRDVRRKQWLSQVKSKECEELSGGGEMCARDGMDQGTRGLEVTPANGEKDGSMHKGDDSDSSLKIVSSDGGSVAEKDRGGSDDWEAVADALSATVDKKDPCDQKFESLLLEDKNVVQPEAVKQLISIVDNVLKPKPATLDRTFKSVLENKNVAQLDHQPELVNQPTATVDVSKPKPENAQDDFHSKPKPENAQAWKRSDASRSKPQWKPKPEFSQAWSRGDASKPKPEFCQAWRRSDAFPSQPKPEPEKHDQKCTSLAEDKNVTQLDHLPEVVKQPTAPMDYRKPTPENSFAWRQDDAFRPKSLPDRHKMHSFPLKNNWHNHHGGTTSGCKDSEHDDSFRPKSLPDPQKIHRFPLKNNWHNRHGGTTSGCKDSVHDKMHRRPLKKNWHNHHGGTTPGCKDFVSAPPLCPICCEDMDSSDSSFLPCSCGFQLCIFCHKRISDDNGRCPGCRKQYDKNDVKWKEV